MCTPCTLYCTGARRLGAQIVPSEDVRGANENAMRATFEPVRCADAMVIRGVTYGRSRPHPAPYSPYAGLCAFSVPTAVQSPAAHGQRTALRLGRISELDLRVSVVSSSVPHSEPNEIQNGDEGPSRAELHETTDSTSRRTKTALVLLRSCGVGLFIPLLASWPPGLLDTRRSAAWRRRGRGGGHDTDTSPAMASQRLWGMTIWLVLRRSPRSQPEQQMRPNAADLTLTHASLAIWNRPLRQTGPTGSGQGCLFARGLARIARAQGRVRY